MFAWLRDWRERRRRNKSRLIYRYWDGIRWRYGDPFSIWRLILNHPTVDVLHEMEDGGALTDSREPETSRVLTAIAEALNLARWDEQRQTGLTDLEVIEALVGLSDYLDKLKKTTLPGRTSRDATGSMSSISLEPLPETGNVSVDSGSTGIESEPSEATKFSEESRTPEPVPSM